MNRVLLSILFVVLGLLTYWFLQPNIFLFDLIDLQNSNDIVSDSIFLIILKNHLADTVWCLAIYQMIIFLVDNKYPSFYIITLSVLPLLSEAAQYFGILSGTFDWIDVFIYLLFLLALIKQLKIFNMKNLKLHALPIMAVLIFLFGLIGSKTAKPVYKAPITYVKGTFTLQPKKDDIFTKPSLSNLLKSVENPSIVLRVPASEEDKITEAQKQINNSIYSTIEKEFAKADYVVRDRALFAKVLEGEENSKNYSGINESTQTDLILELVNYENIKYNTNKYVLENGEEVNASVNFMFTGTSAEFKLISVKDNDLVGSYTFYYTPCTDGCTYKINDTGKSNKLYALDNDLDSSAYEYVAPDVLENFFKECSIRLIKELSIK